MGHDHGPPSSAAHEHRGRLTWVLAITVTILVLELLGGIVAHSIALVADAGHMGADAAGVGLSLMAVRFAARPANEKRTFGFQRAEILAAVINAVILFGVGGAILFEAVRQLQHPATAVPHLMVLFGVVAIVGNSVGVWLLRTGQTQSLNIRGAFLEVASDLLGAGAVVIAAVVISVSGNQRANGIAALFIGLLILPRTVRLLRDAVDILLEATPKDVNISDIRAHICEVSGVIDVHDLHVWTITSGIAVLSAHVVCEDSLLADGGGARVLDQLGECLGGHFDVEHCTFQLEPRSHREHERSVHE